MDREYLKGLIEEILYIWADPIDSSDLSKIIYDFDKKEIEKALEEIYEERQNKNSGLLLKKYHDSYQFTTRKEHDKYLQNLVKKSEKKLSNSSLETLSIIAYKQPITRVEIDKIRGINSQYSIDSLSNKGLIEEKGRLEKIGKPIIYGTTEKFLMYFDIESLDELPELENVEDFGESDEN